MTFREKTKIAIDARLHDSPGIGRYIRELIPQLEIDGEIYVLANTGTSFKKWESVIIDSQPFSFKEQIELPKILHRLNIDLLHSPQFNIPLGWRGVQVTTIHDCAYDLYPVEFGEKRIRKEIYYKIMMRIAMRKSDHIITISDDTKERLKDIYGAEEEKMGTVYHGIGQSFFENYSIDQPDGFPEEYILYVGSARPRKNIPALIEAYNLAIQRSNIVPPLVLVGDLGEHLTDINQTISEKSLESNVYLPGYVSESRLKSFYTNAMCLLFPSLYEGFGFPALEAMAAGTPVIVSDRGGLPEVAGDAGIYIDPTSPSEIADAVVDIANNREKRQSIARRSVRRAKKFSWEKTGQETSTIYRNLLTDRYH